MINSGRRFRYDGPYSSQYSPVDCISQVSTAGHPNLQDHLPSLQLGPTVRTARGLDSCSVLQTILSFFVKIFSPLEENQGNKSGAR
jgi:hypothetical protein